MNIIACFYFISLSQPQSGHIPPVSVTGLALTQSDLPGFAKVGSSTRVEHGIDRFNLGRYVAQYSTPMTRDGRDAVSIDLTVLRDNRTAKSYLQRRRMIYQAPIPHGSLTGMKYADEVDSEVKKNVIGVVALKGRFIIEVNLTFPDSSDKRKSFLASKLQKRKLLVDTVVAKTLQRAASQTWPEFGTFKKGS